MDEKEITQLKIIIREVMNESDRRPVIIENLPELSQYLHKCNQQETLSEIDKELVTTSSAFQQLHSTLQEFMAGQQETIEEIRNLIKSHSDAILIHQTACPHPDKWERTYNRLDDVETDIAEMKRDFDVKRLETNHIQDIEIQKLIARAEESGKTSGMYAGGGVGALTSAIIVFLTEFITRGGGSP